MTETINISGTAQLASRFINQTSRHIFLTGKAGTGKTTFLKHIVSNTHKKTVIAAPTGIAAINAGGVTLHSLFQLPFGAFIPAHQFNASSFNNTLFNTITSIASNNKMHASKRQLLREMELLIIDEVSMLRADTLDAIDTVLRVVRRKNNIPFGGVQCLFIGDLLQLPPVIKDQEWYELKNYYKSVFFFDAVALKQNPPLYIELDKVYRQQDDEFISLLNNLRNNKITDKDVETLNKYYKPGYQIGTTDNTITLTTHNNKADAINKDFLEKLPGPLFTYDAEVEDEFNEYSFPVERRLELKVGAQIMFIKNDYSGNQRYFNGKIGKIKELSKNSIEVEFEDGKVVNVEKYEWENKKYQLDQLTNEITENTIGKFIHYPIKLAWAITVHKSQGLTFDKAIIDVEQAFAHGQVYVALSRLRSLDGLILTSRVNYNSISTDVSVSGFSESAQNTQNPANILENETLSFLRTYLANCFDFSELCIATNEHFEEYKADDKKSVRSKYYEWAKQLKETTFEAKSHADKFIHQTERILAERKENYLEHLCNRVRDAKNYFEPILKKAGESIYFNIEKLKEQKKTRQFAKELSLLEVKYFEQNKKLGKALGLCNAMLTGKEFDKEQSNESSGITDRIKQAEDTSPTKAKPEKKKEKKDKTEKRIVGKELSLKLYQQGMNAEEIAKERGMAVSTIEGHLAQFVDAGKLKAEDFVSKEKIKNILAVQKELNTLQLTPIKNLLGDEYSYSDIRFAIAGISSKME